MGQKEMAVKETAKTRTHFSYRIDTWTDDGETIVERVAGIEDYDVARPVACRTPCKEKAPHRGGALELAASAAHFLHGAWKP